MAKIILKFKSYSLCFIWKNDNAFLFKNFILYYIYKKEKFPIGKDNPNIFLNLLKIPHTQLVLYLRYGFILLCCLITRVKEKFSLNITFVVNFVKRVS